MLQAFAAQEPPAALPDEAHSAPAAGVPCCVNRFRDPSDRCGPGPSRQAGEVRHASPQDVAVQPHAEVVLVEPRHSDYPSAQAAELQADALRAALVRPAAEKAAVLVGPFVPASPFAESAPAPACDPVADAAPALVPQAWVVQVSSPAAGYFRSVHLALEPAAVHLHFAAALAVAVVQLRFRVRIEVAGELPALPFAR